MSQFLARLPRWLLPAALLLAAVPTLAQQTTGTILGTVTDDSGSSLPGATVTLSGPRIVGAQTAVSSDRGTYRIAAVPPGDYILEIKMSGFGPQRRQVKLPLGQTIEESFVLKVSQRTEEVTVVGETPVVNSQTNEVGTNYDKDWVQNAPVARYSFFDLIDAAPGVSRSATGAATSTSFGGGSQDNSYQLDGTDFTAPSTGEAWPYPNTDAIEEIQVLSLGAPAEYGNLLGAVFNVVTRQGTNAFHGDLNFYYQANRLTAKNTTFAQDNCADAAGNLRPCPFHRSEFTDVTAQIDGPIIKDKLWFFASYQRQRDAASFAGSPPEFPTTTNADRMFLKLNYQVSKNHKLMFAYHDDFYHLPCQVIQCSASIAPSANTLEHGHNPSPNVTYTGVLSDRTYAEVRVSGFFGHDHGDPLQPGDPRVKPRYKDLNTGQITGGIYSWYDGTVSKKAASAKVSHFADNFLGGSHDFKFGVQYNEGGSDYVFGKNDYIYTYGTTPSIGYTQIPYHQGGTEKTIGGFFDDSFRVSNRLTLNLGVRYDHAQARIDSQPILDGSGNPTGQAAPALANLFTWNPISPRLGLTFKVTADGKTLFKTHWGRYYRGIITGEFQQVAPSTAPRYSFSGTYDSAGNPIGLTLLSSGAAFTVDPNYRDPHTDQFIASFERELLPDLGVALTYVHKQGTDYGAFVDTTGQYAPVTITDDQGVGAIGAPINLLNLTSDPSQRSFNLTNPAGMYSRYNGATLQITKRMSHHWQMVASLVVSKATGRLTSSGALCGPSDEQAAAVAITPPCTTKFGQNPNDFVNTEGLLSGDRPVVGKIQLVYELPAGFLVGLNYIYQQGRPWAREIILPTQFSIPTTVLAEPLNGSRRVGNWNLLDLRIQKAFALKKDVRFQLFADILNLFNNSAYDAIASRDGTTSAFGQPTLFVLPRRAMVGAKFTF
jgi:hypothetical protein